MGIKSAGYRKKGQRTKNTPHARAKHQYERRAAMEYAKAMNRDGSSGPASEVRKVVITPEVEQAALVASGVPEEEAKRVANRERQEHTTDGPRWQRSRTKLGPWTSWERY